MALPAIHHRPLDRRSTTVIAVVLAALIATFVFVAYEATDISVGRDPATVTPVLDPSLGPNQDLAPTWGSEPGAAEATGAAEAVTVETSRGPNADLAPAWGIERSPAEAARGPNQDLPPAWD